MPPVFVIKYSAVYGVILLSVYCIKVPDAREKTKKWLSG
jgi:hypothetical protein